MRFAVVALVMELCWFVVNVVHPFGPPVLRWVATPVTAVVLTSVCVRTARTATLPAPTRRFWRHLAVAGVLVAVASVSQAVNVLLDPAKPGPRNGPLLLLFDGAAVLVVVLAIYRLPMAAFTRGQRMQLALDGGTVMIGAVAFIWHFQTFPALHGDDRWSVVASLVLAVAALIVVLAVAKVALTGVVFIDASALRWLAIAIFVGTAGPLMQPLLPGDRPGLLMTQVSIPAVFCAAAWAGERQRRNTGVAWTPSVRLRLRPYSIFPYAAVAAVDGLLMVVAFQTVLLDRVVVVASVVVLTALVVTRQILVFADNTRLLHRLDHNATHDALTGLANRTLFQDRLQDALQRRDAARVVVALIDLDDFKDVNDRLGHETGDKLLVAVADKLRSCVGGHDTVARLGGDEFVMLWTLPAGERPDAAVRTVPAALAGSVSFDGMQFTVHASIGFVDSPPGEEASALLRRADMAMYEAKKTPGTVAVAFRPEMETALTHEARLVTDLRQAVQRDEIELYYQPIVALDTAEVIATKVLARWHHPVHGLVPVAVFIGVAERTGLVVPLGRYVLRRACEQLRRWQDTDPAEETPGLSVNVSARELREADFAAFVRDVLTDTGLAPSQLTIEITETATLDEGPCVAAVRRLHALGVRICLNDFGAGATTLSALQHCPVDEITLDRRFTAALGEGNDLMARAVISLAESLGVHVVAEGVETAQQAASLRGLGYRAAQGHFFHRPAPAAAGRPGRTSPASARA